MKNFSEIIEQVKTLSMDEKEELHLLLEKYLIEARRDEIKENYQNSKKEKKSFSSDVNVLKSLLNKKVKK